MEYSIGDIKMEERKNNVKIRKALKYVYMFITLAFCFLTLKQLAGQVVGIIRVFCYILCLFSVYKSDTISNELGEIFDSFWKKVLRTVIEVYATFSIIGMYFLKTTIIYKIEYPKLLYFLMSFFWVCPIIRCFIVFLIRYGNKITFSEHKAKLSTRFILMGIMMVPCILFLIAFNPAITTVDSETCLSMADSIWKPGAEIINGHPPFYALALKILRLAYDSITFLIVVQEICFVTVFVDGILFLYQCGYSRKMLSVFYIFITFGISNIIQLTTLWKDIPYMISLMWLTLLLMKFVMRHDIYKNNISWYVQFVIAIIFTAFFRQNGILPALAVIVIFPIAAKFSKKALLASSTCILLIMFITGPLYKSMNVVSMSQLKFVALANDIMYSYYEGSSVSDEAMEIINKVTSGNPNKWVYFPYIANYNPDEPSGYSVLEFLKIYCKNALQNPVDAVMAVATRNSVIWSIAKPNDEWAGCVNHLEERNTLSLYPHRVPNRLTNIFADLCNRITNNKVLYVFLWRTGIYNLLIIIMTVVAFCAPKKRKLFHIIPFVPIVGNVAALFIASGWPDYRYFWPSMSISLFLLFFFLFEFRGCFTAYSVAQEKS